MFCGELYLDYTVDRVAKGCKLSPVFGGHLNDIWEQRITKNLPVRWFPHYKFSMVQYLVVFNIKRCLRVGLQFISTKIVKILNSSNHLIYFVPL